MNMSLNGKDIRFLKGVGEKRAEQLKNMGIATVDALLRFYPRAYEDWKSIRFIDDCDFGERVCIKAKIITPVSEQTVRKNMVLYKFTVSDGFSSMAVTVFNNRFLARSLHEGSEYLFFGKMGGTVFMPSMSAPEIRETANTGIRPVYRTSAGVTSAVIEKLMREALKSPEDGDPLPKAIRDKYKLCELKYALDNIHFPSCEEAFERAKRRLVFEELFVLQTSLMLLKGKRRSATPHIIKKNVKSQFLGLLPFSLTKGQMNAVDECLADMSSGRAMNRLIQGDVGSGKTAVAATLCFVAAKNGMQCALMAPTEILAEQHFDSLSSLFKKSGIRCCLITGSLSKTKKAQLKQAVSQGGYDVVIGTHALLSDDLSFRNLALVITDEQHRFGVSQRAKLAAKSVRPHTLVMSATPIPRTLALIIYGDLDISIIGELPSGRQPIESYYVDTSYRGRVYGYIKKHLDEGRQGYIVCPMVEENEETGIASAEEYFNNISASDFSSYRVGLLHGQMRPKEKDEIMRRFVSGEIQLLVCTTVIEVGIDVPNAAIMLIENAERFGLSQLHQLRGRIGRGQFRSTCILMSDSKSDATKQRLDVIKNNRDGFKIADEDLRLRGPGDFLGYRQHGLPELKIADMSADIDVLKLAGMAAANLLEHDPKLTEEENLPLREEIKKMYKRLNEN